MNPSSTNPDEVRQLARQYMLRTGMTPADFARRIGYHYNTLIQFMGDKYRRGEKSTQAAISEAISEFITAHPGHAADEFTGKLYEIGNVRVMRGVFRNLCEKPCILLAYAPPGSGKTNVARGLMAEFQSSGVRIVRVYCREGITKRALMHRIAEKCGSIRDLSIERTISNLRFDFAGRRVALYFDEAQHLSVECLETVRELYDEMGWSLCFAGSHQLDRIFTEWAGQLEQLERRITDKVYVPAVTPEEAEQIIQSEIPGLSKSKARLLIESSHVQLKGGKQYLSIGRVMANVEEFQKLTADAPVPVPISTNPVQEEVA